MPPRQSLTVYRLLRLLLVHALRGHGSDTVDLMISQREDSTAPARITTAEAADFAWGGRDRACTLIGYESA